VLREEIVLSVAVILAEMGPDKGSFIFLFPVLLLYHMIPETLFLVRKVLFGPVLGFSVYFVLFFSKPILESGLKRKFNDDAYFWFIIFFSVVIGIMSVGII